ncbi:MAG: RagB/SusD family nutrient uptake outer membrane protein [Bacteroidota bacterium]
MNAVADFGVESGWGGTRTTSALVNKFPAVASGQGGGFIVQAFDNDDTNYPEIYVPGNYVGWNPNNAPALASRDSNGVYQGYINFPSDTEFKITPERSFNGNFGDDGADGTLDDNGDNILVTEAGFYRLEVDLNALTYDLAKTTWGIIGSATAEGWDADTDMTYDEVENAWTIETFLSAGEMKFRANDEWTFNLGDDMGNSTLEQDGANIVIPANSNYRIKLFLAKPEFTYSIETTSTDMRATFHTDGQNLEIEDISQFTDGYGVIKFNNLTKSGSSGSSQVHVDTDFPMFRLADAYLMYAEAVLRGGTGGDLTTAIDLVNQIRFRAYGDPAGQVDANSLTLDFLLDERARELHWEAHRRQDLVRFGQFSDGNYLWPWKGGVAEGRTVPSTFDVFPIPSADLSANPNLKQNDGY